MASNNLKMGILPLLVFIILPLKVTGLTCEEATAQIKEEVKRAGLHSQQLDTHLSKLVEDVHALVDKQVETHHTNGIEFGCHIPTLLENGIVEEVVDWFGQKMAFFQCNLGFLLIGSSTLICTESRWNASIPKCAATDCKAHHSVGHTKDGIYGIIPDGRTPLLAYCDMKTDGGGWTMFQRRMDNSVSFYRTYSEYQRGFGNIKTNFWLGLDALHFLTQHETEIYVDMVANATHKAFARYSSFAVGNAASGYKLSISGYSGDAGNSFSGNAHRFTTYDKDQDSYKLNCAQLYKGGWWYTSCHSSNPNGLYLNGSHPSIYAQGIQWFAFTGHHYSLQRMEMKLRRKD